MLVFLFYHTYVRKLSARIRLCLRKLRNEKLFFFWNVTLLGATYPKNELSFLAKSFIRALRALLAGIKRKRLARWLPTSCLQRYAFFFYFASFFSIIFQKSQKYFIFPSKSLKNRLFLACARIHYLFSFLGIFIYLILCLRNFGR